MTRGMTSGTGGEIHPDALADIATIERLVAANPEIDNFPVGHRISNAMASLMMKNACEALEHCKLLEAEGRGSAHEVFRVYAERFAVGTLLLVTDRETRFGHALPKLPAPCWKRLAGLWGDRQRQERSETGVLSDEDVATMKREAQNSLTKGLTLLESLPRPASFEGFKVSAVWFAEATLLLAQDREARLQLQLAGSSAEIESPRNSKEG
jgi:hypothetical protein